MEFNVINEENVFKLGNIISIFKLPKNSQEIALFSIGDYTTDEAGLFLAYLNTDAEGYDYLTEINNTEVYKKALSVAKDMIGVIKENE